MFAYLRSVCQKMSVLHIHLQAEGELQRASIEASRVSHALEQQVDSFEAKKIRDVKKVLREFVQIELVFHAKALELYTQCFQSINIVDPDADLEVCDVFWLFFSTSKIF